MDVREKLVELLEEFYGVDPMYHGVDANALADHLIANSVTIQEWISVNDRLPEPKEKAICLNRDGEMMIGTYTEWGWMFPCYFKSPTHWMPMPQPPKGE